MPLMFFNDEVSDDELYALRLLAGVIDAARVELEAKLVGVTEECPLHEAEDDLAGFGFVACQKYLTSIAAELEVEKKDALALGPLTPSGETLASLVNEAANAWKHEAQWCETLRKQRSLDREPQLSRQQQWTADRLDRELGDGQWDYKYANALFIAAPSNRFSDVVDRLSIWRDAMIQRYRRRA